MQRWQEFYPSRAVANGIHSAIFQIENRSDTAVQQWLTYNKSLLLSLSDNEAPSSKMNAINRRMLMVQLTNEVHTWEVEKPHQNSIGLYTRHIQNALSSVMEADFLTPQDKGQLVCSRLAGIANLVTQAGLNLQSLKKEEATRSFNQLKNIQAFIKSELVPELKKRGIHTTCAEFEETRNALATFMDISFRDINARLMPKATAADPLLGRDEYARRLGLYTDSDLTPEKLLEMAMEEINTVRELIAQVSADYLAKEVYKDRPIPSGTDKMAMIKKAFADMEADAPTNGADYLAFWLELEQAALRFIEEKNIATLPDFHTLRIKNAPESAGPAARIGWVSSAPPFHPNPVTTLYLPSIPDTLPEQEQKEFWASFNKPFNRMIVIHELLPGHYMQLKISRETPHPIRLLFPYGTYIEGWATLCERVVLDAGWEKENPLTMLAHLRKRLENANRAYTSVQVHCFGWTKEQVMKFSTETFLLAPQFAKSLWGRIMRSPMQLTSYYLGSAQFTALLASEKARLGHRFDLKLFMDTIMKAGPIPIDEFEAIFKDITPTED